MPSSPPIPSTTHLSTSLTKDLPLPPSVPTESGGSGDDSDMRSQLEALRAEVAQLREHLPVTAPRTPGDGLDPGQQVEQPGAKQSMAEPPPSYHDRDRY